MAADTPPARVVVFLNPKAGSNGRSGTDVASRVREAFAKSNVEADLASIDAITADGALRDDRVPAPAVIAAGGDGTVNTVAGAIAGTHTRFGVLPLGTLNHFAKDVGVPLDLEKAVGVIAAGHVEPVDLGEVNGHVFLNNCSIGVYPAIVRMRERLEAHGHGRWLAAAIAAASTMRWYPRLLVTLCADGRTTHWTTPFVMVANNEYDQAGVRLSGRRRLDGGQVVAYLARQVPASQLPTLVARTALARLVGAQRRPSDPFVVVAARELTIDVVGWHSAELAIDGEVVRESLPLRVRCRHGALNVLAPAG